MKPEIRDASLAAVLGAAALALPTLFHLAGLGSVFLPMFLPLSAAGFLLPLRLSLPLAAIVPLASFVLTGMPPLIVPPIGPIMMLEIGFLIVANRVLTRGLKWNLYVAAMIAVAADRAFYMAVLFVAASLLRLPRLTFSLTGVVSSLPGAVLLATIVPAGVTMIRGNRPS
jgi:hypothetical protein